MSTCILLNDVVSSHSHMGFAQNNPKMTHKTHKAPPLVVIAFCFTQQLKMMRMWISKTCLLFFIANCLQRDFQLTLVTLFFFRQKVYIYFTRNTSWPSFLFILRSFWSLSSTGIQMFLIKIFPHNHHIVMWTRSNLH